MAAIDAMITRLDPRLSVIRFSPLRGESCLSRSSVPTRLWSPPTATGPSARLRPPTRWWWGCPQSQHPNQLNSARSCRQPFQCVNFRLRTSWTTPLAAAPFNNLLLHGADLASFTHSPWASLSCNCIGAQRSVTITEISPGVLLMPVMSWGHALTTNQISIKARRATLSPARVWVASH